MQGDPELLKGPAPAGVKRIVWEVVEPVLSPDEAAHLAEIKAEAERKRRAADDESQETSPDHVAPTDDPPKHDGRGPVELKVGASHSPHRWRNEYRDAARQGRLRVKTLALFTDTTRSTRRR